MGDFFNVEWQMIVIALHISLCRYNPLFVLYCMHPNRDNKMTASDLYMYYIYIYLPINNSLTEVL